MIHESKIFFLESKISKFLDQLNPSANRGKCFELRRFQFFYLPIDSVNHFLCCDLDRLYSNDRNW